MLCLFFFFPFSFLFPRLLFWMVNFTLVVMKSTFQLWSLLFYFEYAIFFMSAITWIIDCWLYGLSFQEHCSKLEFFYLLPVSWFHVHYLLSLSISCSTHLHICWQVAAVCLNLVFICTLAMKPSYEPMVWQSLPKWNGVPEAIENGFRSCFHEEHQISWHSWNVTALCLSHYYYSINIKIVLWGASRQLRFVTSSPHFLLSFKVAA